MEPGGDASTGARDVSVDLVRLAGVVAVVAGHTWTSGWVREVTFPWHVPVFFVMTGFLWRSRPLRAELGARVASLMRPYVLWLAVAAVAVVLLARVEPGYATAAPHHPAILLWGGSLLGGPFTAFWFISCLFAACLLYAAVDAAGPRWRAAAVAVAAVTTVVGTEALAGLPLSIGVALPALVFVEAGRWLRRAVAVLDRPVAPLLAVLVLAVLAVAGATGSLPTPDLKMGEFGVPVVGVLWAVTIAAALLVLARRAASRVGTRTTRVVTAAAGALVPVVLLHPLVLAAPETVPARFLLALAVPLAIALVLRRTAWSGWALGR